MLKKSILIWTLFFASGAFASPHIHELFFVSDKCPLNRPIFPYFVMGYQVPSDAELVSENFDVSKCMSCDITDALKIFSVHQDKFSAFCPNRETVDYQDDYFAYNILKKCPSEKPLKTWNGCTSCDIPMIADVVKKTDCDVCNNRYFREGDCILKECPSNNPVRDPIGSCRNCNEDAFFVEKEKDCEVCPNHYFNKETKACILKKECPEDKPLKNEFLGFCDPCSSSDWHYTQESCEKCPNRVYEKGGCQWK